MALSANREVNHYVDQELRTVALAASTRVYKGALIEWGPTGYARPVTGAGQFVGLAYEEGDNSGGDDGDVSVRVYTMGDFGLPLAGAVQGSVGAAVYASDDATLTLDSDAATFVGYVQGLESAGNIVLRLAGDGPARMSPIDHRTANFGVSARQSGTTFTNAGAGGTITATLPQSAAKGTTFAFVCMADQALRIAPGAAGGIYIKGAKQADNKYVSITDIGDFVHLIADGNGDWVAVASIGGADADISVEA
ncbi:MAG: hypothetical protein KDA54_17055 [Phycisphaerales bacterium]|nr:hypothetical protein [Phycisphaerales bacterium]